MNKTRILFSIDDFKTRQWGEELKKYNFEIVPAGIRLHSHLKILLSGYLRKRKIHAFIFRYLNDRIILSRSIKFFLRDFLIILLCKFLRIKIIWLLHNIDEETNNYHPFLSRLRRKLVYIGSEKVLVTDPHLLNVAHRYGIKKSKLDWTCFGIPEMNVPDQRNRELKEQIQAFKESLRKCGNANIYLGLCVSDAAKKKVHFLNADTIVGKCKKDHDSCVGLVLIGKYPEGREFELAKVKARKSPYILLIDESFPVNEPFIADLVDFVYRSMTDQSIAYTIYVACNIEKPLITHNTGALPLIIKKEKLGFVIPENENDIPGTIIQSITVWNPTGAKSFLGKRSWEIGSKHLMNAINGYSH